MLGVLLSVDTLGPMVGLGVVVFPGFLLGETVGWFVDDGN